MTIIPLLGCVTLGIVLNGIGAKPRGAAGPQPDDTSWDRRRSLSAEVNHRGEVHRPPYGNE